MFTSGDKVKEKVLCTHWVAGVSIGDHERTKKEGCVHGDSEAHGPVYLSEVHIK